MHLILTLLDGDVQMATSPFAFRAAPPTCNTCCYAPEQFTHVTHTRGSVIGGCVEAADVSAAVRAAVALQLAVQDANVGLRATSGTSQHQPASVPGEHSLTFSS